MLKKLFRIIKYFYDLRAPMSLTIHFGGDGSFRYDAAMKEKAVDKLILSGMDDG